MMPKRQRSMSWCFLTLIALSACGIADEAGDGPLLPLGEQPVTSAASLSGDPIADFRERGRCPGDEFTHYDHAPLVPFLSSTTEWLRVGGNAEAVAATLAEAAGTTPVVLDVAVADDGRLRATTNREIAMHPSFAPALAASDPSVDVFIGVADRSHGGDVERAEFVLAVSQDSFAFVGFCTTDALTLPLEAELSRSGILGVREIIGLSGAELAAVMAPLPSSGSALATVPQYIPGLSDESNPTDSPVRPISLIVSTKIPPLDPDSLVCVASGGVLGDCVPASELLGGVPLTAYEHAGPTIEIVHLRGTLPREDAMTPVASIEIGSLPSRDGDNLVELSGGAVDALTTTLVVSIAKCPSADEEFEDHAAGTGVEFCTSPS
ncbi:MAG: hypothetical protein ACE37B_16330 [Ilumatobacter sp.]|uniref:hypothetical protein n=1 Tax=Ilumatobacter sp. TaxID=1967498 RepID=UPI00391BF683